jgi:hypothetical protein
MVTEATIAAALLKMGVELAFEELEERGILGPANEIRKIAARARLEDRIQEKAREIAASSTEVKREE